MNCSKRILDLTDSDLGIAIEKYDLILVDCYTGLSSPCKRIAQTIDEMVKEYTGKAMFGKINVNVNRITANRFDIMNVPTLLIFKEGNLVDNLVGVVPRKEIEDKIKPYL